ncbi:MAG: hypothetical protein N3B18_12220 [Desulfobacterota bacterium]|nr:hypothetical protein [Thermodesulfobacteriota bacterium]
MAPVSSFLKQNLQTIIRDEYEECKFFVASASMLSHKFTEIAQCLDQEQDIDFARLRDLITEIGLLISNAEKRLQDVDECYTKLVEALAADKQNA